MEKTFINYFPVKEGKSGIKIKPENKGKFNATKKRTGKTTEELTHSKNPLTRKRAIFAQNAKKWKHADGGYIEYFSKDNMLDKTNSSLIPKAQSGTNIVPLNWDYMTKQNSRGYKAMQDTWNYLINRGVSARNAAAIMGNIMQESSFDPLKVQQGGDNAVGYFQMHGNQLKAYRNWLKTNNRSHSDYAQLDYILDLLAGNVEDTYMKEYNRINDTRNSLRNKSKLTPWERKQLAEYDKVYNSTYASRVKNSTLYPYSQMIEVFNNPDSTLDEATDIFTNSYERAGKPMYEQRRRYASDIYEHFNKKPRTNGKFLVNKNG